MGALTAIIIFGIIIVVHEFGHFIAAKQAGVKVEKFSIGFGPPIFKYKGKETTFLICIFPLGGYVKMAGEEKGKGSGADDEFTAKPVGLRARIVLAGPLANYLLAFIIFWVIAFVGFSSSKTVVGEVAADYPAEAAGLIKGDTIVAVDDQGVSSWKDMAKIIQKSTDKVKLTIVRDNKLVYIESDLVMKKKMNEFGKEIEVANIGIASEVIKYDIFGSFLKAGNTLKGYTVSFFRGIYAIFSGALPFEKAAMGPLGIYFISSKVAVAPWLDKAGFLALLSLSIGLINLFPIPILDGGCIMFFLVEKIRKKEVSKRTEDVLTKVGLSLLVMLLLSTLYFDIKRGPNFFDEKKQESSEVEEESSEVKPGK